ncbi:MAG TPA: cytochrome c [Dongiaceae bacterium]|jgi:mono/diheme cytochrome c family protein|nr:cytochrome c [Dongiaceae bacterium]
MIGRRRLALALAAVAIAIGAVTLWWQAVSAARIDPGDARQVAAGGAVYRAQCARCHGANLEGQPDWQSPLPTGRLPAPPHDESGHTWHHPDDVLVKIVKEGPAFYATLGVQTDMPGFRDMLSDRDIAAVISYIKSRWPPAIQARQARMNR